MTSEFIDSLHDVFSTLQPVTTRRMFGGTGLFHSGLMFAIVIDDLLYLKADKETSQQFIHEGCEPFTYSRQGKQVALQYYSAPDCIYDDSDDAALWAQLAFSSALRCRRS